MENAFKYGISSTEESVININLTVRKGILRLNVYNSHIKEKVKVSSRKGVQNVKKRLDLLYPDRYTLRQKKDKDGFTVRLYIKLT